MLTVLASCQKEDDTLLPAQDFSQFNTFDKLSIASGFETTVQQGATRQVLVSVPAVDKDNLRVEQVNGTLNIQIVNKRSERGGKITIVMPTLVGGTFSGGTVATLSGFTATTLPLTGSGGSIITYQGTAKTLTVGLSGGSITTVRGTIETLTLDLSGGSKFNGYEVPATTVTATLTGGSQARVAASQTLNVTASGGSQLFYRGTPTITQNLSGGSTITKQ